MKNKNLASVKKIVASTRTYLNAKKKSNLPWKVEVPDSGIFSVSVSFELTDRALSFTDLFLRTLINKGHKFAYIQNHKYHNYNGPKVIVDEKHFDIRIREVNKRVKIENENSTWVSHQLIPTGKLCLTVDNYPKKDWIDAKHKLVENKISTIISYLEENARKEKIEMKESKIAKAKYEEIKKKGGGR